MINENELPKNWEIVKVKDIALSIQYGYTESSSVENVGPKFLRITDIQENRVDWKSVPYCKISEDNKGKYKLQDGDLVFARTGATVGKSFLIKGEMPDAIFASYLIRLRFPKTVSDKFVYNFFQSHFYWKQIVKGQVGIGQPNVNGTKLGQLLLTLPPLAEQERIVAKIEELFSELDAGLESLKTAQAQLKTYRQAVLKYAFEGKLTNDNINEGELPNGWRWEKLGDICKTIDGDRGANYPKKNEFSDEGYCLFLSTKNVRDGRFVFDENIFITREKDEKLRGGKLQLNDVVITTRGTLGNVALYDERIPFEHIRINSGMLILRITNDFLLNYYLMKFITSPVFTAQLKEKQTGTAQPQIPANILREIEIPFGSLKEQQRIVEEIESRLSVCDKLEETINASLKQAEALRQSILKQAFEGKLVRQEQAQIA